MNRSLAGVVQATFEHSVFGEVYGASHGLAGVLEASFLDLRRPRRTTWRRVANTPGAALGSGRRSLAPQDVPAAVSVLRKHGIGYLFTIGGNDSAETAHAIAVQSVAEGDGVVVVHVPKTIDNDLMCTDPHPRYGERRPFRQPGHDGSGKGRRVHGRGFPRHRSGGHGPGFGLAGGSRRLGKRAEMDAPHYICVPEAPLDEARFLDCMEDAWRRWGFAAAVTAENVRGPAGRWEASRSPSWSMTSATSISRGQAGTWPSSWGGNSRYGSDTRGPELSSGPDGLCVSDRRRGGLSGGQGGRGLCCRRA